MPHPAVLPSPRGDDRTVAVNEDGAVFYMIEVCLGAGEDHWTAESVSSHQATARWCCGPALRSQQLVTPRRPSGPSGQDSRGDSLFNGRSGDPPCARHDDGAAAVCPGMRFNQFRGPSHRHHLDETRRGPRD